MPIAVACPCGAKLKAPDAAAGKRLKCPKCGAGITVPSPAEFHEQDELPPAKPKPLVEVAGDSDERPQPKSRRDRDDTTTRGSRRNRQDSATQATESRGRKKSNLPLILGIAGGVTLLLAIGAVVAVIAMNGTNAQAKATGSTPGGGPESAQNQSPAGWKEFRAEGVSLWVPESVNLSEQVQRKDEEPKAPLKSSRGWSSWQLFELDPEGNPIRNPNPKPNPFGVWYGLQKSRLDRKFVAKYPQDSPAASEAALKQIEELGFLKAEWSDASLGGLPAKQRVIKVTTPNPPHQTIIFTCRMMIRGETLYRCDVECLEADASGPLVTTFFDSFRVVEPDPVTARPDEVEEPLPQLPPVKLPGGWKMYKGEEFSLGVEEGAMLPKGPHSKLSAGPPYKSDATWYFHYAEGKGDSPDVSVLKLGLKASFIHDYRKAPATALDELTKGYAGFILLDPRGDENTLKVTRSTLGGIEARQAVRTLEKTALISRYAVRGDAVYRLQVSYPGVTDPDDPKIKPFFDSFRFEKE